MELSKIFDEVSTQMRSDFRKAQEAYSHSGLKGQANEDIVRRFLQQYLPKALDIVTGTIVDSSGGQSRQLDIILSDAVKTPIFFQSEDARVIPAECAYSVIEVKAHLDKKELDRCQDNMTSCKSLAKHAYFYNRGAITQTISLFGKEWQHFPLSYFVFAFDSVGLDSLVSNLNQHNSSCEIHQRIDSVCVLDKGVILNQLQTGFISALPEPGSRLISYPAEQSLLMFYAVISVILNQVSMPHFNIQPYLQNMVFMPTFRSTRTPKS